MRNKKEKHFTYFNLIEGIKYGCPICFMVGKNIYKFMDAFLYESVNDSGLRKEIRESSGFCNRHSWQLQKFRDSLGMGIIYEDILESLLRDLKKEGKDSKVIQRIIKSFSQEQRESKCIFCQQEHDIEIRYIFTFIENFKEPEVFMYYKRSPGLCLPHLAMVVKKCKDKKLVKEIIDIEKGKISDLVSELKEFIRKQDYHSHEETFGREKDSWIRAIRKLNGRDLLEFKTPLFE